MISRDRAAELESLIRAAFPAATIKNSKNKYGTFWVEIRHGDARATAVFMPKGDMAVFILPTVKRSNDVVVPREHPMPSVSEAFEFVAEALNANSASSFVTLGVLQEELDRTGIPKDFVRQGDGEAIEKYGEIRSRLYESHRQSLTNGEHRRFNDGVSAPNRSKADSALVVVGKRLGDFLKDRGFAVKVQPALYHGPRWVMSAELEVDPGTKLAELPWLFGGFEVKYSWPSSE